MKTRTILYKQAALMANRVNKQLKELATGEYSVDDIVRVHDALNQIEAVLNSLVVVNKAPDSVEGLKVFEVAVPTIIREELKNNYRPVLGSSPLDEPHETNLRRTFK